MADFKIIRRCERSGCGSTSKIVASNHPKSHSLEMITGRNKSDEKSVFRSNTVGTALFFTACFFATSYRPRRAAEVKARINHIASVYAVNNPMITKMANDRLARPLSVPKAIGILR